MNDILMTLLNSMVDALIPICITALTALFGFIGTKLNTYFKSKDKAEIVRYVVKYVEQIYTDIHGKEKLDKAVIMATMLLNEKGIKVSSDELNVMIESACYELKVNLIK